MRKLLTIFMIILAFHSMANTIRYTTPVSTTPLACVCDQSPADIASVKNGVSTKMQYRSSKGQCIGVDKNGKQNTNEISQIRNCTCKGGAVFDASTHKYASCPGTNTQLSSK